MLAVEILAMLLTMRVGSGSPWSTCSSRGGGVLVVSVFVLLTTARCTNCLVTDDVDPCRNDTLINPQHYVLENESIMLTCNMAGANASDMYFISGDSMPLPSQILNSSAIQMTLPVTRDVLDRAKKDGKHSYNFKCKDGRSDSCVGHTDVFIDYYPVEAVNVTCRIYGWERMRCWWSLWKQYITPGNLHVGCDFSQEQNLSTEMHLKEEYESYWSACPHLDLQTSCFWDADNFISPFKRLHLRIAVSNDKRRDAVALTNASFLVDSIVQLNPVDVTQIAIGKITDPNCLEVSWNVTGAARYKKLFYNITYNSSCSQSKTVTFPYNENGGDSGRVSISLCSLHPHSTYSARFTGRYIKSDIWSEPVSKEFTTAKQIPDDSPLATAGLYEHIEELGNNIRLYWKPLGDCELNSEPLNVEYQASDDQEQRLVHHPVFYTNLKVNMEPVTVRLQAKNDIGYSKTDTSVVIYPKHMGPKPSELTVIFSDKDDDRISVTIEVKDDSAVSHTLVWCQGTTFCEKPVNWKVLDSTKVTLQISNSRQQRFGLITRIQSDGVVTDTGIKWEECLYQRGKAPASAPRNVHRSDQQPATGFRLEWLPYECREGYLHHYLLSYCEGTMGDLCNCTSSVSQMNVSKQETSHAVTGLPVGAHFCVWLQMAGSTGTGPQSDTVFFTIVAEVKSPWLYIGVTLAILIIIGLAVLVFCCFQRYLNRLQRNQYVKTPDIDGLMKQSSLVSSTTTTTTSAPDNSHNGNHGNSSSEKPFYQTAISADSGTSSLSTGSRNQSSESTTPKQVNSDSAISSDLSQQIPVIQPGINQSNHHATDQSNHPGTDQSNHPGSDQSFNYTDSLESYQKAGDVSAGCSNPDSYMKMSVMGNDSDNNNVENSVERPITERSRLLNSPQDIKSLNDLLGDVEEDEDAPTEYDLQDISAILGD